METGGLLDERELETLELAYFFVGDLELEQPKLLLHEVRAEVTT